MSLTTPILRPIHFGAAAVMIFLLSGCSDEPTSPEQAAHIAGPSSARICSECDIGGGGGGGSGGTGGGDTGGTVGAPLIGFETIPSTPDGDNGWFKTLPDVKLTWVINPRGTLVGELDGCDDQTIAADQAATFTCSASNETGPNSVTASIRRDATAPVVTVNGVIANHVYANDDAPTPACSTTDNLSGVATDAAPQSVVVSGVTTVTCSGAEDVAGNTQAAPVSVSYTVLAPVVDAPVVSSSLNPAQPDGLDGWYTSNVALTWNVVSSQAAQISAGCATQVIQMDQISTVYTCSATNAGGTTTETVSVKRDASAPELSIEAPSCSIQGNAGWCRGTQTVTFSAVDGLSGLANGALASFAKQSTTEGGNIVIASGTVSDVAGNEAASINAGPFKIDRTGPTVTVTDVVDGQTYAFDAAPTAGCSTSDMLSGVQTDAMVSVSGGPIGTITATCRGAADNAGNLQTADVSVSYEVSPPPFVLEGFTAPVSSTSVNTAKAGQAIALKWRLLDGFGVPVTNVADVKLTVSNYACDAGITSDLESEGAAGNSGLQNLGDGYYQYNWKTPKSYANSCKLMRLQLLDVVLASPAEAQFFFKR